MKGKNDNSELLNELVTLIEETKSSVTIQVNSSLTLLFWYIGNRISNHILQNKRAEYGKQIVVTLSREITEGINRGSRTHRKKKTEVKVGT